jgi:glycosyltransferase involved in cell wall biosynthesis
MHYRRSVLFSSLPKGTHVQLSLSALLPVHNAQSTLEATVSEILEVLSELSHRLELVVVDDASTDATIEVLPELAACYPQVRVARHGSPLGRAAAIRTGLAHSTGDVLFFQDDNCTLAINELHRLWKAIGRHPIVLGRAGAPSPPGRPRRKRRSASSSGNYQLIRRAALEPIQELLCDEAPLRDILLELGHPFLEVEVRDRAEAHRTERAGQHPRGAGAKSARPDPSEMGLGRPGRPNYLRRLRDFALGE